LLKLIAVRTVQEDGNTMMPRLQGNLGETTNEGMSDMGIFTN
jgi:hypothetical protein